MAPESASQHPVEELIDDYLARRVSRRAFFRRAGAIGLSVSAAASILAACSGGRSGDSSGSASVTTGGGSTDAGSRCKRAASSSRATTATSRDGPGVTTWDDPGFVALYEFPLVRDAERRLPAGALRLVDGLRRSPHVDVHAPGGPHVPFGRSARRARSSRTTSTPSAIRRGQNAIFWPTVKNATASDPTTVVVTMKAPFTAFPETLATENSIICNVENARSSATSTAPPAPTAAGRSRSRSYQPGTEVVVNRWDGYPGTNVPYCHEPGSGVPRLGQVGADPRGRSACKRDRGRHGQRRREPGAAGTAAAGQRRPRRHQFPALANYFISLNCGQTKLGFDDINVRQAISHAIDRQALVDSLFFGQAVATYGPIAPNFKWYDPGSSSSTSSTPRRRSRCLTGPAGPRDRPVSVRRAARSSPAAPRRRLPADDRRSTRRSWRCWKAGVEMKLNPVDDAAFYSQADAAKKHSAPGGSSGSGRRRSTCSSSSRPSRATTSTCDLPR